MLKYMLDTNIVIYAIKNRPQQIRSCFKRHQGQ
ncbi:MAG: VapC toxin family PIN domain ribonuclease, partial [Candidatus Electrothrix sp. AW1]|nr:VapC toxin family PIN domain ribonuclease [Candidatus Electrothrix gigas]